MTAMSTTNNEIIAALNAFAARGMAAEADALAYCSEQVKALGAGFSSLRFMDNFRIAARANDQAVEARRQMFEGFGWSVTR